MINNAPLVDTYFLRRDSRGRFNLKPFMRIPQSLPQFVKKYALLIVSGKQAAKVFFARNLDIVELEEFKVERPHYSDNEGFSTHGRRHTSGSVSGSDRGIKESEILTPFLKTLRADIKKILQKYNIKEIYLFVPDYMARMVPRALPKHAQQLVRQEIHGNFVRLSPVQLLHKIDTHHI